VDVEEQHLVPLLRKHAETKALATDAAKASKDLRAQLSALGAMPKDNDDFLASVNELKKSFQQHVRDERKELLPAVLKALSDEEADETAEKMEAAVAEAAEAKRAAKQAEAAEARREATEAQEAEDARRAASRAEKAAQRASRDATEKVDEMVQQASSGIQERVGQATDRLVEGSAKVASSARDAMTIYRGSSQDSAEDLRAISASSMTASKALLEVASAWSGWVRKTAALNVSTSRKIMQCKSLTEVAQVQREFVEASMRTWMEGRSAVLQIGQQASKQALNPLKARLEVAA
jgi:hypothetical protein